MKTVRDEIEALVKEREQAVIRLLQSGSTYQRIGELTGLSITTVMQMAHRNGMRRAARRNSTGTNTLEQDSRINGDCK
jgi:uncharacterized protein YerC